jgi:transposase InsO family protein
MDIHQNARTTPHSRAGLVRRVNAGELPKTVAAGVGVCDKTVRKWATRFAREGAAGLADRSSRPHRLRRPTAPALVEQAIALRRQRLLMKHIAARLELSIATVSIDDHSRLSYAEVRPNERKETTTAFLVRALDHFQALGISVARIMTDNGSAYRSHLIADLCRSRRMRHIFTRPYTPRTNGKAERFIQTALREWAYAKPYDHSQQRADALPLWIHSYNHHRAHRGIGGRTLISRLPPDNLLQPDGAFATTGAASHSVI